MSKKVTIEPLLSVNELSEWINVSTKIIYELIRDKEIPYTKVKGKYIFDRTKIQQWLNENTIIVSK